MGELYVLQKKLTKMNTPYTPPKTTTPPPIPNSTNNNIQHIAKLQRYVNYAFLAYLCVIIISIGFSSFLKSDSPVGVLFFIFFMAVAIFGAVSVFRLAKAMSGVGVAIIAMLGMLIPVIGLIILLVINGSATKKLKQAGYKVGLLGAEAVN